jgi:hypothetical protein
MTDFEFAVASIATLAFVCFFCGCAYGYEVRREETSRRDENFVSETWDRLNQFLRDINLDDNQQSTIITLVEILIREAKHEHNQ